MRVCEGRGRWSMGVLARSGCNKAMWFMSTMVRRASSNKGGIPMKLEHVKEIQSIFEMGHVPLVQINTHALHLQGSTALFVTVWY